MLSSGLESSPVLFFHNPTLGYRGRTSKGFAQLPFVPNHLHVPGLSVLAWGVFRFDATALSFATVRWRGIRIQ